MRSQTDDPCALWTSEEVVDRPQVVSGPCCIIRVMATGDSVDVVGEAYLSEDLPSLIWTIESFPIGTRDVARAIREANAAAHRHGRALPRIRVIAIHEIPVGPLDA